MITRMAIFEGTVKSGREAEMRSFVNDEFAPLWRQFAGADEVRVLFASKLDPQGPVIPCILQITYPNKAAIEQAMASPARQMSREMLPAFYEQFFEDVRLYHYEFIG